MLQHEGVNLLLLTAIGLGSFKLLSLLKVITLASWVLLIASYSYCSMVTKSLLLLIIMLLPSFTLLTTPGFPPSVVNLTGHAHL
jgi:hypothetical protein